MVYVKTRADLVDHYNTTKSMLRSSCEGFDRGDRWEAVRIATATYSLVHDGGRNSRSILTQLNLRSGLRIPSRVDIKPGNFLPDTPLVFYRAKADGTSSCEPILGDRVGDRTEQLQFPRWWDQIVLADGSRFQVSRKSLVFSLRNQDGGAHVDPTLRDVAYVRFAKVNPYTPRIISTAFGARPFTGIAEASMRHVAWELQQALDALGEVT